MNGKGDSPRPLSIDSITFASNWDRIFGKKQEICEYSNLPAVNSYNTQEVEDASKRSENHYSQSSRIDEDGNRIEQEAC